MDSSGVFVISLVAYIIHLAILSWVIRKSVLADKSKEYQEITIRLLRVIAEKQGATEEEVKKALGVK